MRRAGGYKGCGGGSITGRLYFYDGETGQNKNQQALLLIMTTRHPFVVHINILI